MNNSPLNDLPVISSELKAADSIPLTGNAPSFPWEDFSSRLATLFERKDLRLNCSGPRWRPSEALYEGMSQDLTFLSVTFPTLKGQVFFVIPRGELPVLTSLLLTQDGAPLPMCDSDLDESFYHFFAVEVLYLLNQVPHMKSFSPVITSQSQPFRENALCFDITLHASEHTINGRLVISQDFRKSWVDYFSHHKEFCSHEDAKKATVTLCVKIGETELFLDEWKHIQLGDVLIVDNCSLSGDPLEGRVTLTHEDKLVWRAKIKNGSLKILELPLVHEVKTPMTKQDENAFDDDLSDLDFLDEKTLDESQESLIEDEEKISDGATDIQESTSEVVETNDAVQEKPKKTKKQPEVISPEKIPVSVVIELGRVTMPVEMLLKLEAGNFIETEIDPKNGVDLTINGQIVGRGELVRIGETIGVRILDLGRSNV